MSGIPISAMTAQSTLADTDQFPFVVGSALGDNRKITWADLKLLLQTYGGIQQSVQTTNYTDNNIGNSAILNHNIVLTEGKYLITWNASAHTSGTLDDLVFFLVYNTNPLLTAYDASDVTIQGSLRGQRVPATGSVCFGSTGLELTVPPGSSYIVKVIMYEAAGQSYTVESRVLTALKTL